MFFIQLNLDLVADENIITDANNATNQGRYLIKDGANQPSTGSWFVIDVIRGNDNACIQLAYSLTPGYNIQWLRKCVSNTWSAWSSMALSTDIIVKEFRKTGISVTPNTITVVDMSSVITVPSGYQLAAVTPTLSGAGATQMIVSCNQRLYRFFSIYSLASSSDLILDVNCIFIRQ